MYAEYEREYTILKSEVSEIRTSIMRYLGFVIGAEGVTLFVYRTFKETPGDFVLVVNMVILTLLYGMINYKLASHNRHTAYMQLLTQEIARMKYKNKGPVGMHTNKIVRGNNNQVDFDPDVSLIVGWEYVMSRWNSAKRSRSQYPTGRMKELDFVFALSNPERQREVEVVADEGGRRTTIPLFLEKIIWEYYNKHGLLRFLWRRATDVYYKKYLVHGWGYPAYVYTMTLSQIVLVTILLLTADTWQYELFDIVAITLVAISWVYFTIDLLRLLFFDKTIDYFCWAFFPFRVQLLNSYGIRPIYFSTLYARYCRSLVLLNALDKLDLNQLRDASPAQAKSLDYLLSRKESVKRALLNGYRFTSKEKACLKCVIGLLEKSRA